jgi:hypothetical protein
MIIGIEFNSKRGLRKKKVYLISASDHICKTR